MSSASDEGGGRKQPRYLQIADDLREKIETGVYPNGAQLPGENELAETYQVAIMTARKAIGALRTLGLVESRKGVGVFVRSFRPIRRKGIQRLREEGWGSGQSIWETDESREVKIDQIVVTEIAPDPDVARVLGLAAGELVICRSRRFLIENRPVMLARSFLPSSIVAGSAIAQTDTGPGGTFARLRELGYAPDTHREEIRIDVASGETARRLGIPSSATVINLVRTTYAAEGRPVEVSYQIMDAAAYVLEYSFPA